MRRTPPPRPPWRCIWGVSRSVLADAIPSFPGLPHRQQRVAVVDGVPYVDDSKATNADSAARALGCYRRIVWIAGGVSKAGGIAPLAPFFPRLAHTLLIGRDGPALAAQLGDAPHEVVETLERAVPRRPRRRRPHRGGCGAVVARLRLV